MAVVERSTGNKVAVIDASARGAALAAQYAKSEHVSEVHVLPGNDLVGINSPDKLIKPVPEIKSVKNTASIVEYCRRNGIVLVDVAQDDAVALGTTDELLREKIPYVVGPTKAAGEIEWDKYYARLFGMGVGLQQPNFRAFMGAQAGIKYMEELPENTRSFIKAAGLAEGKGVVSANSRKEAQKKIKELKSRFREAASMYLIEEALEGEEFSAYALSDGETALWLGSAQDNKRANNYDEGENTGGMGVHTSPLIITKDLQRQIQEDIFDKTFAGLRNEGRAYKGVMYLGGMAVKDKGSIVPKVIEFNARWGAPEAEALVPGITTDFYELGVATATGKLHEVNLQTDGKQRVVVVLASRGYPGDYSEVKGKRIWGIDEANQMDNVTVFGAGVERVNGTDRAKGGRLVSVVGEGNDLEAARRNAYNGINVLYVEGNNGHFRTDIASRDRERILSGLYR